MRSLLEDLRYGLRIFRGSPGLTLTAIFTLAIGIAVNATVFGWVDGVLLHPIPGVTRGGELASLETKSPNGDLMNTAYADYRDYRDGLRQVSGLAASLANVFTVGSEQNPRLLWGEFVSANYFSVLGVRAVQGRTFLPEESPDAAGGPAVVVIGDRLWQSAFHGDPHVIGKVLRVNRRELTVIGVVPFEFHGTVPGLLFQMWIPLSLAPELNGQGPWLLQSRDQRQMWVTARLRQGVSIERARAEVAARAQALAEAHPETNRGFGAALLPVWKGHLGAQQVLRTPLQVLMAVCLLLFLIVAANVANLQLVRTAARQNEFGIRTALGAKPARLLQQLLTESLLLSALGAAGGVLLSTWCGPALLWLMPPSNLPIELGAATDWNILAFSILLAIAAAVLTGIAPAFQLMRGGTAADLREGARGLSSGKRTSRTRSTLVIAEVALAMVALVCTGVLIRGFYSARAIDSGMDTHNVACAKYYVETFCKTTAERRQFCQRLSEHLREVPGVAAVSYGNCVPLEYGEDSDTEIEVQGYVPAAGESMRILNSEISPDYFQVQKIALLEGRDFSPRDDVGAAPVVIVNQAFEQRFFGNRPGVGRKIRAGGPWATVVAVVADSKYRRLTEPRTPWFYTPSLQTMGGEFWLAFFVRTTKPLESVLPALRREAAEVNPLTRGSDFIPYRAWVEAALYSEKAAASLVGAVGAISLLLSAVGLFSVLSFSVKQRTHEFGIRIALGGRYWNVLSPMLLQGMTLTAAGVGAGTLLALAVLRVATAFLPKLSSNDVAVFAGAMLILGSVAFLASFLPARRAAKVDPMVALRHE